MKTLKAESMSRIGAAVLATSLLAACGQPQSELDLIREGNVDRLATVFEAGGGVDREELESFVASVRKEFGMFAEASDDERELLINRVPDFDVLVGSVMVNGRLPVDVQNPLTFISFLATEDGRYGMRVLHPCEASKPVPICGMTILGSHED